MTTWKMYYKMYVFMTIICWICIDLSIQEQVSDTGCHTLAGSGDCEFYRCVEDKYMTCGDEGYALKYGYKQCQATQDSYHQFNDEGKKWSDDYNVCMMEKLLPFFKNMHLGGNVAATCEKILHFGFDSQSGCYLQDGDFYCSAIEDNIHVMTDIIRQLDNKRYPFLPVTQLLDPLWACPEPSEIVSNVLKNLEADDNDILVNSVKDVNDECVTFAGQGDCRFFECFEQRFPCSDILPSSHVRDFEYIQCRISDSFLPLHNEEGKALLHQVRISVMEDLLDIYTADNPVNCASLHFRTFAHRATEWQKYEDFPDVIRANEFAVDHSLDTTGFPFTSDSSTYHPSSVLRYPVRLWWPYHQAARALRRHMGYMLPHPLYVTQYTGACDTEPCLTKLAP